VSDKASKNLKLKAAFATVLVLFLSGTACVSVNIGPGKTEKASNISFAAPGGGFKALESGRADAAWNNSSTGSTIAFQSNCGDAADLPLESIAQDLFTGFEDRKTLRDERIPFDSREALDQEIEGKVDGVMTRVRAIIYKKNKCNYVLTFVALTKNTVAENKDKARIQANLNGDVAQFENFMTSFKAP